MPILEDTSPESLAAVTRGQLMALNLSLRQSRDAQVFEEGGFFRWRAGVPHPYYNGVVCAEAPGPRAGDLVASTVNYFRRADRPDFVWWPSSKGLAEAWRSTLTTHGFEFRDDLPGMAADLSSLAPSAGDRAFDIRRVENEAQLRIWSRVFIDGNTWPVPWAESFFRMYRDVVTPDGDHRCYLLYEDGEPVATSSVYFALGVAGIYDVATLPSARRRGYGGAVTRAPLLDARDEGYRIAVLQSSALGVPVYERLGFRRVGLLEYFGMGHV